MQSQGPRRVRVQIQGRAGRPLGIFGTLVAATLGVLLVVAGFFLSIFLLVAFLGVAIVAGGWFWWRTRQLRRQFKEAVRAAEQAAQQAAQRSPLSPNGEHAAGERSDRSPAGPVIEGDYIRRKDD